MAGGVNKVILVGNLGADPEVRFTPSGQAVANFRIATSESWTDKAGQKQERTEWHRIVVWGKLGELCGEYLAKGRQCFVEGRLQTRGGEGQGKQEEFHHRGVGLERGVSGRPPRRGRRGRRPSPDAQWRGIRGHW